LLSCLNVTATPAPPIRSIPHTSSHPPKVHTSYLLTPTLAYLTPPHTHPCMPHTYVHTHILHASYIHTNTLALAIRSTYIRQSDKVYTHTPTYPRNKTQRHTSANPHLANQVCPCVYACISASTRGVQVEGKNRWMVGMTYGLNPNP